MPYTNIVGIDPSTTCTGLCINGKTFSFSPYKQIFNKKDQYNKWYDIASQEVEIYSFSVEDKKSVFTDSEVQKISQYDEVSDNITDIIKNNIDVGETICVIEGFSYNATAGRLIDLVVFSTLLRYKILKLGYDLQVVPPATLKVLSAKLTYEPIDVGKKKPKLEWRNRDGVAGGKFTKHDMVTAVADNSTLDDNWAKFIKASYSDLISMKNIPKPFEDVNDAYLLYKTFTLNQ